MDFSSISLAQAIGQVFGIGLLVVSAYAGIWASNKVIDLIKHDSGFSDPNDPDNYDHDVFAPMPPSYSSFEDDSYDPNGNYAPDGHGGWVEIVDDAHDYDDFFENQRQELAAIKRTDNDDIPY